MDMDKMFSVEEKETFLCPRISEETVGESKCDWMGGGEDVYLQGK
jgi:hypothetical protein